MIENTNTNKIPTEKRKSNEKANLLQVLQPSSEKLKTDNDKENEWSGNGASMLYDSFRFHFHFQRTFLPQRWINQTKKLRSSSQFDGGYSGRSWDRNWATNIMKGASIKGLTKPKAQKNEKPSPISGESKRCVVVTNILGKGTKLRKYPWVVRSMITSTTR